MRIVPKAAPRTPPPNLAPSPRYGVAGSDGASCALWTTFESDEKQVLKVREVSDLTCFCCESLSQLVVSAAPVTAEVAGSSPVDSGYSA